MTETERMAREAGCFTPGANRNYWAVTNEALARFAELVRAAERERCAKLCEAMISRAPTSTSYADYLVVTALADAAELIRGQAESGQR